jgi:hypothetical protein
MPHELAGLAGRVTVNLPWGSLLRGALALDAPAAAGIAELLRPDGVAELLLAPAARDRLAGDIDVPARVAGSLEADWRALGMELLEARPATAADVAARRTTWGRRLGLDAGRDGAPGDRREPWYLELRRAAVRGEAPRPRPSAP